jgi:spermidine/putrescine-binding protein
MRTQILWKALAAIALLGLMAAACGGSGPAANPSAGTHTTSSGFACPEPSPRMELTSTELNLFVWTEYIPQDVIDCFEAVYGITVNRDEYSANEEMYQKLLAVISYYDMVQPTDYIVTLMVRQ